LPFALHGKMDAEFPLAIVLELSYKNGLFIIWFLGNFYLLKKLEKVFWKVVHLEVL